MTMTRRLTLAVLMVAGMLGLLAGEAAATHFRGTTVESRILSSNVSATTATFAVQWTITSVWRRGYEMGGTPWNLGRYPQVGDIIRPAFADTQFDFGDGSQRVEVIQQVIAVDPVDDWIVARGNLSRTYSFPRAQGVRQVTAALVGCCRLSTLVDDNYDRDFVVAAGVVLDASVAQRQPPLNMSNQGPKTGLPGVITALDPPGPSSATSVATFSIPAVDPDGDAIEFDMQASCLWFTNSTACDLPHEFGLATGNTSGVFVWTVTPAVRSSSLAGLRAMQYTVTDALGNFVSVDTLLSLVRRSGNPPVVRLNGSVAPLELDAVVGGNVSATVDVPGSNQSVTLATAGLPGAAVMSPSLPTTGLSPLSSTLTWTPRVQDVGTHIALFTATDSLGQATSNSATIRVRVPNVAPTVTCPAPVVIGGIGATPTRWGSTVGLSDPDSPALGVRAFVDGTARAEASVPLNASSTGGYNVSFDYAMGVHTLEFTVTDGIAPEVSCATTVTVLAAQTMTFEPLVNRTFGDAPFALQASVSSGLEPIVFEVLSGPATLSGNIVTLTGVGTVVIRASQAGTDAIAPVEIIRSFNVARGIPVVTWPTPADIVYGTALGADQLNATSNVTGTFVYTPAAGTVLSAGSGQPLSVIFTPADTDNFVARPMSVSINVLKGSPVVSWPTPADIVFGTALGAAQLNATADVPGTFTYEPAVGTGLDAGEHQLTATFTPTDAVNYAAVTVNVSLVVQKATPTIVWTDPDDIVFGAALGAAQLNATASVPGTFAYTPAGGVVLNAGNGQVLSTTLTPENSNYAVTTRTVKINVLKATPLITWATPADIVYGTALGAAQLNATATVPGSFVYTPAAGTVLDAGSAQVLSVTFTPNDTTNYSEVTASTKITVLKATPVITWATPAPIVYGAALGSAQLNATSAVAGSFVYTPAAGTVLSGGSHTLSVAFTPADGGNYSTATAAVSLQVQKAATSITWATPAPIVYGAALGSGQLNATASVPGSFIYTPAAGTVLNAGNGQTLSVVFTPADTANYVGSIASVAINVLAAPSVVSWASPADIVYGTPLGSAQLNASANTAGTFTYTPPAGTVLASGSHVLSVLFTPADGTNYNPATASVTLKVGGLVTAFSDLASASIVIGPASVILGGRITAGSVVPTGHVSIVLNGVTKSAAIGVDGRFAATFATGALTIAGSPYTITYSYAGTTTFEGASATATLSVRYGFRGLKWLYGHSSHRLFKAGSTVPLAWQYTDASGRPVKSAEADPTVMIDGPVVCGSSGEGDPVAVNSRGRRGDHYHAGARTWHLNWKTTGLQPGCYNVRVRHGQTGQIDGPFALRLRDGWWRPGHHDDRHDDANGRRGRHGDSDRDDD